MKSFIEFLREDTEPDITTTSYSDKATGVNSYFHHDNKTGDAYWGYQVPDGKGGHTDLPPEGLSPEAKSAMSRASRAHLTQYMTDNPGRNVTAQFYPTPQGEANHNFYQKFVSKLKENNPEIGSFTRVTPKPSTKPGLGLGGKLGILGVALGIASGASADEIMHSLHPLSILAGGVANAEPEDNDPEVDSLANRTSRTNNLYFEKQKEQNRLAAEKEANANPKHLSKPIPKNYTY